MECRIRWIRSFSPFMLIFCFVRRKWFPTFPFGCPFGSKVNAFSHCASGIAAHFVVHRADSRTCKIVAADGSRRTFPRLSEFFARGRRCRGRWPRSSRTLHVPKACQMWPRFLPVRIIMRLKQKRPHWVPITADSRTNRFVVAAGSRRTFSNLRRSAPTAVGGYGFLNPHWFPNGQLDGQLDCTKRSKQVNLLPYETRIARWCCCLRPGGRHT